MEKYKNLYNIYWNFVKSSFELLKEFHQKHGLIYETKERWVKANETSAKTEKFEEINIIASVRNFLPAMKRQKEYLKFKKALRDIFTDASGKIFTDETQYGHHLSENYIPNLFNDLFEAANLQFDITPEIFKKIYILTREFIRNKTIIWVFKCPLPTFDSDVEYIQFEKNLIIRKLSQREKEKLQDNPPFFLPSDFFSKPLIPDIEFTIEYKHVAEDQVIRSYDEREKFENLIKAMEIYQSGKLEMWGYISKPVISYFLVGGSWQSGWGRGNLFIRKEYFLQKQNVPFLKRFYKNFLKGLEEDFINRTTKRFHSALQEDIPENRIVDFITVLEGLYLPNTSQELGYKLAIRAAIVLGKTKERRHEIFNLLREAYDLRSRVVHCDNKDIKVDPGFVKKIEDITRESLKIFINKLELHSAKKLDELVLKINS